MEEFNKSFCLMFLNRCIITHKDIEIGLEKIEIMADEVKHNKYLLNLLNIDLKIMKTNFDVLSRKVDKFFQINEVILPSDDDLNKLKI